MKTPEHAHRSRRALMYGAAGLAAALAAVAVAIPALAGSEQPAGHEAGAEAGTPHHAAGAAEQPAPSPDLTAIREDASCLEFESRECTLSEEKQAAIREGGVLDDESEHHGDGPLNTAPQQDMTDVLGRGNDLIAGPAIADVPPPFSVPLRIPPVLTGSNINITMAQTDEQVLPTGPRTRMWTYNGTFPGPTIRRPSGQTTRVNFSNRLPAEAGQTSVHHHGNHSRSSEDGQADSFLIPTNGARTYTYEEIEDGRPERAVTQWYHDHRMAVTGRNVWNGLAGFYILNDGFEASLPLPGGEFDVPLMIVDREFDANNQIPYEFNVIGGALGNTLLVNGRPQPFFDVGDRKYRFRLLNASNSRPYTLRLSNGQPMTQIGTDSGLMPRPLARQEINMQPAERVEVVIDFAGQLGQNIVLENLEGAEETAQVMQFRVTRDLNDPSRVPSTLRPAPSFDRPSVTRNFELTFDEPNETWLINNEPFNPQRVLAFPRLGTSERWIFKNNTFATHVIHLHDVDWRIVHRNNQAPPPQEAALKETFRIDPDETFEVRTRFTDNTGIYLFHCHILEHEDKAMMAQFRVVP